MKTNHKILLVENNKYHSVLIERTLLEKFQDSSVDVFVTVKTALKATSTKEYDIAIIGYNLNGLDGIQLLQLIRQVDINFPVIITALPGSEYLSTEAINSGASEFLIKNEKFYQVLPRVVDEVYRRYLLVLKNRELENKLKEIEENDFVNLTAGVVLHEINNPLMAILGTIELLLEDKSIKDNNISRKLGIIKKSANRIKRSMQRMTNLMSNNRANASLVSKNRNICCNSDEIESK